jgi:hypothetical protein
MFYPGTCRSESFPFGHYVFIAETQENIKNLHEKIEQNAAINELEHIKHVKWIKATFIIGCSAVGITLTQLILQLLGIL